MAEKENKGVTGFDPLAWMNEKAEDPIKEAETEIVADNEKQPENVDTSEEALDGEETEAKSLIADGEQKTENETNNSSITLAATLNIQNVNQLYEVLLIQLDAKDLIEIDASAVVSIDTATLQLLIVLKQEAVKVHKEISIDFPSDKFIEAAELLGLAEMLEVDQAAAGFF
jgi:ABC-type transporter Mla MlaB component